MERWDEHFRRDRLQSIAVSFLEDVQQKGEGHTQAGSSEFRSGSIGKFAGTSVESDWPSRFIFWSIHRDLRFRNFRLLEPHASSKASPCLQREGTQRIYSSAKSQWRADAKCLALMSGRKAGDLPAREAVH